MITADEMKLMRKSLDSVLTRLDKSAQNSNDKSFVHWYVTHRGHMEDLRMILGARTPKITGEQIAYEFRRVQRIPV